MTCLDPSSADSIQLFKMGEALLSRRRVSEAITYFDHAQRLGFEPHQCAAARWNCWMLAGAFERAWQESDFIAATGPADPHRFWDGRPWKGQRVMLRCLHGLGDAIQFIRYAPLLRASCDRLIVQTHPQLVTLLRSVPGVDTVVTWSDGAQEDQWDMQMEINEIARAFRTTTRTIPSTIPYISIAPELVDWAARHFPGSDRPRIGLCWRAGPWNPIRSIDLIELASITEVAGVEFYSLQKDATRQEMKSAPGLRELERYASNVQETAAFILNLDLIITVDTMTAHLAGALGRPVWIMLPAQADWRWMLRRRTTPWYPAARLFRQRLQGDWNMVIARVKRSLEAFVRTKNRSTTFITAS